MAISLADSHIFKNKPKTHIYYLANKTEKINTLSLRPWNSTTGEQAMGRL
jgi:hypothetical protein